MRISDWSSDVCSSDLINGVAVPFNKAAFALGRLQAVDPARIEKAVVQNIPELEFTPLTALKDIVAHRTQLLTDYQNAAWARSEEHTSELQSLMRISYAVFCLKKKNQQYILLDTTR